MFDKMPMLALGFRPFYLLAAIFAVVAIPVWILSFPDAAQSGNYLQGLAWHSHEMIFGFAAAVITGFLFTAVRNWTGRPTPVGGPLAAIAALWVLARVMMLTGPAPLAAIADVIFLPVLGIAVAIPIVSSRNTRNYKILAVIAGLTLANASYHLASLNLLPAAAARTSLIAALDVIAILVAIVGGRVIPAFVGNAVADARPRHVALVEFVSFAALITILALGVLGRWIIVAPVGLSVVFALAAIAHGIRLSLWQPLRALGNPLLLMLPIAYAWLPITLALRAFAAIGIMPATAAFHALTVGAIASLMMAMMTRSSLGHSGRSLIAGKAEIAAFVLLQLAAVVRVVGASIVTSFYVGSLLVSGVLWTAAFAVFLWRYLPILTQPRIDDSGTVH